MTSFTLYEIITVNNRHQLIPVKVYFKYTEALADLTYLKDRVRHRAWVVLENPEEDGDTYPASEDDE